MNNFTNSVYCSNQVSQQNSFCCPQASTGRNISCYSIPQLNQFCSDQYLQYPNYKYLKYQSCVDPKHICGERNINISASLALNGLTREVKLEPDTKNCFWILSYQSDENEEYIFDELRESSPVRINILNISGATVYIFKEEEELLSAIKQNITDNDDPLLDIEWQEFSKGEKYYVIAIKDSNAKHGDFAVSFSIELVELEEFKWVVREDEAYLYIATFILIGLSIFAMIVSARSRRIRLRKASTILQTKKVKIPKKRQRKRKSNFFNPFLNINGMNPNNQDPQPNNIKLDENTFNQSELKELLAKGDKSIFMGDQSMRAHVSLIQKIEDSFFSSESQSDYSEDAQEDNNDKELNNTRLIQGNENLTKKQIKRNDSGQNSGIGQQSGRQQVRRMQSNKFKQNNNNQQRNYLDNTADLTANDIQWNESSHGLSNDPMSQSQGSPPYKKGQLIDVDSSLKLKKHQNMTYKDLYRSQRNQLVQAQSERRKHNHIQQNNHRGSLPNQLIGKGGGSIFKQKAPSRDRNSNHSLSNLSYKTQGNRNYNPNHSVMIKKKKPTPLNFVNNNISNNGERNVQTSRSRRKSPKRRAPKSLKERSSEIDDKSFTRNLAPNTPQNHTQGISPVSAYNEKSNKRMMFTDSQGRSKSQQIRAESEGNQKQISEEMQIEEFKDSQYGIAESSKNGRNHLHPSTGNLSSQAKTQQKTVQKRVTGANSNQGTPSRQKDELIDIDLQQQRKHFHGKRQSDTISNNLSPHPNSRRLR
ncbi:UNKNOWN [Stylonychia lemnae]|uniref:Transmembrane protein n=1 Tax=Stylonychia lemnae TaxID=5949 RepID=A0A078AVJ9_STYLE|nr:UNKNOWN [Stylonychia lemnae]|eukprot:CDW86214.1 UNKNOWN [Stylonychia lemnae]